MCSYGLESKFDPRMYEDFEALTLAQYRDGKLYGLEKYWAFHFYRKDKDKPVPQHPHLKNLLEGEFRSMDDFRKAKERASTETTQPHRAANARAEGGVPTQAMPVPPVHTESPTSCPPLGSSTETPPPTSIAVS